MYFCLSCINCSSKSKSKSNQVTIFKKIYKLLSRYTCIHIRYDRLQHRTKANSIRLTRVWQLQVQTVLNCIDLLFSTRLNFCVHNKPNISLYSLQKLKLPLCWVHIILWLTLRWRPIWQRRNQQKKVENSSLSSLKIRKPTGARALVSPACYRATPGVL